MKIGKRTDDYGKDWQLIKNLLIIAIFTGLVSACSPARNIDNPNIRITHYQLSPVIENGGLMALAITIRFQGDADGETAFRLPDQWGGEEELYKAIMNLTVSGESASIFTGKTPDRYIIRHAPLADLTLSYQLVQDWAGMPGALPGNPYRPIIQAGYFHVIGWTAFAYLDVEPEENLVATIEFTDLPDGWSFASDLEHQSQMTLVQLQESVLVGGDFRILTRQVGDTDVRIALRGELQFEDDRFANQVADIMAANYGFWDDADESYLVTTIPLSVEPGRSSMGGTGLSDAFAFFISGNIPASRVGRILAHEHLHSWIPKRVGGARIGDTDETLERLDYWFSEGFTDFYTWRLGARSGRTGLEEAVSDLNEVLERYGRSPVRTAPNTEIQARFWTDQDIEQLPYDRGMLAAFLWDAKIRTQTSGTKSLDDVMHVLRQLHQNRLDEGDVSPPGAEIFIETVREITGTRLDKSFEQLIARGNFNRLPDDILSACGHIEMVERPVFERGFDGDVGEDGHFFVSKVDVDSAAWSAGLRNGMIIDLTRSDSARGDPDKQYRLALIGDEDASILFFPRAKATVSFQQLLQKTAMNDEDRRACLALITGE